METDHTPPQVGHAEPSGAMVRTHWATWQWFTSMTKTGIVVVTIIVAVAMFFMTR